MIQPFNPIPRILKESGISGVHSRVLKTMSTPLIGYLGTEFQIIMKKLIVIACLLMMITNWGFSQSNTKLQGPKAKNAKPWKNTSKKSKVVYLENKEVLQGPAAKNAKPWHKKDSSQIYVEVGSGNRPNLKGPKAKNFKPWMSPKINAVDSIAIRDSSKIE